MSEEKKKEVLDQEKDLDESEMEEVSGGGFNCTLPGEFCVLMAEMEKKCVCVLAAGGK